MPHRTTLDRRRLGGAHPTDRRDQRMSEPRPMATIPASGPGGASRLRRPDRTSPAGVRVRVTTSWDDGHVFDLRLADLLEEHQIAATFYLAPRNVELPRRALLVDRDVAELATRVEVGAHTWHHVRLPHLDDAETAEELRVCKEHLEHVTGRAVTTFCYPGGAFLPHHPRMVAEAGYTYGRTVERFTTSCPLPFTAGTTIHALHYRRDVGMAWRLADGDPRRAARLAANWDELAMAWFDRVLVTGGDFHLWGHSWEVDAHDSWGRLRRVLEHIGGRPGVEYVTNGGLVEPAPAPPRKA